MAAFTEDMPTQAILSDSGKDRSHYEGRIRYWCNAAYEEAKRDIDESPEIKQVEEIIEYLDGNQWRGTQPSHRARPVTNKTLRLFWEMVGLLTDIQPVFQVHAVEGGDVYKKSTEILNLITKAWALENSFDMKLMSVVCFAMLTTSSCKLGWDSTLAHSRGDLRMDPISANNLMVVGGGEDDLQEAELVVYRRTRTLNWIRRRFPQSGGAVRPDPALSRGQDTGPQAPAHISPQLFKVLGAPMQRAIGVKRGVNEDSVFPKAEVREFWTKDWSMNESSRSVRMGRENTNWCYDVKPGDLLYPRGRVITMASNVILDDQPNPYWHARHPFARLRLMYMPWKDHGSSPMKPLIAGQNVINKIHAGVLNMIAQAISPQLLAPRNAFSPEAWKSLDPSRPNEKVQYSAVSPHKPEWKPAPQLPAYVLQMETIVGREMDMFSGAAAMAQATQKKQVPSGDSLEQISQSKNTPIRLMGRNIEDFIKDLGKLFVPSALQFYSAERRYELLGAQGLLPVDYDAKQGSLVPENMTPEDYARKFRFQIEQGTLLNVQKTERINMALKLRAMRMLSMEQTFKILDFNIDVRKNKEELLEEAKLMASVAPPPAKGKK
jgi:hypothetical protein